MTSYPIPLPPGGLLPLPTIFNKAGLQQTPPTTLRNQILAIVTPVVPDYTSNLPGILIEDILSTDVGALSVIDSARVELLNSLTPYGANPFILNQLGQVYGVALGLASNTSVLVQFTATQVLSTSPNPVPVPGYVIPEGFIVSDGTYSYQLVDGGVVGSDGVSPLLFAIATISGTWAVPAGTVTQISTSVPTGFQLTVVNPEPGIPGASDETEAAFRARVLTAGLAASQGMARYLKTLLNNVPGVQTRLIAVQQNTDQTWTVIAGGGDPYQIAYAIYTALFDINNLEGSTFGITGISVVGPNGISTVTIDLNSGYTVGEAIQITEANPPAWDGNYAVYSLPTATSFVLGKAFPANQIETLSWAAGVATATTLTPHGITPGSNFTFVNNAPTGWNGTFVAIAGTVASTIVFDLATNPGAGVTFGQLLAGIAIFNGSSLAPWVSGGQVNPNARNVSVNLTDFPDIYTVPFVVPPQQNVVMTVNWNTSAPNFVNQASIAQAAVPALVAYVNSVYVGQPLNLYQMQTAFEAAITNILPPFLITRLAFTVSIDGVGVLPDPGTGIFEGDAESFFFTQPSYISVIQG